MKADLTLNQIDELAILDREVKAMTKRVKTLKEDIANTYGEGNFRGEQFGVRVTIENRKGTVNMEALCKAFGITEADLDKFRGDTDAIIKVCPTA